MHENAIAKEVVDACYNIHRKLGPGLLENVYEVVLAHELVRRGLEVKRQLPIPVTYGGVELEIGFRLDLLVNEKVIVEVKSVEEIAPVHRKQLLTYLRLAGKRLGLLVNFNEELIRDGLSRVVNCLKEE